MNSIDLQFGTPHHGWLPVSCIIDQFKLEFEASDIPVDPIYLLCEALIRVLKGLDAEVWWYLEPGGYYFIFAAKDEDIILEIRKSVDDAQKGLLEKTFIGNFESIILPLYRCLQKFTEKEYPEGDWPSLDLEKMVELTELVNRRRL